MPRKKNQLYSNGELNKLIDSLIHPIANQDPAYWLVDTFAHGMVEQNPELTVRKFIRYNAPKIIRQLIKSRRSS